MLVLLILMYESKCHIKLRYQYNMFHLHCSMDIENPLAPRRKRVCCDTVVEVRGVEPRSEVKTIRPSPYSVRLVCDHSVPTAELATAELIKGLCLLSFP